MKKSSYCVKIRLSPISSAILPRPEERSNGALNDDPSGVIGLQISGCYVKQCNYRLFVRLWILITNVTENSNGTLGEDQISSLSSIFATKLQ